MCVPTSGERFVLASLALGAGCVVLIVGSFLCYRVLGTDLLPEMDEGAHPRLPDARGVVFGRYQRSPPGRRENSGGDARSGEHLAPHRSPVRPRCRHEANNGDFPFRLKRDRERGIDEIISELRQS